MGWATVIMRGDAEERAVVTASMNAIGQDIVAGTQVVQFPAAHAPDIRAGFLSVLATCVAQLGTILLIQYFSSRDQAKQARLDEEATSDSATRKEH